MKEEKLVALLKELIRNSRRSDRELAKAIGASQPTVTRNRKTLDNYISSYTVIPKFGKIGYEILAVTFATAKTYDKEHIDAKVKLTAKWLEKHPNVIFSSEGEGLGKDVIVMSFHENYSRYADFIREYSVSLADFLGDVQSFIVSLKSGTIFKAFDVVNLAEDIKELRLEEQ
jgi:DNA-binding Lrp family transcriptional regulator